MKPLLTEDGSNTLFSNKFGESYHSIHGAKTEALHVFIESTGIQERLDQKETTRVLEIGFGLGLNFLLTADLALRSPGRLSYHAIEFDPIRPGQLNDLNYRAGLHNPGLVDMAVEALRTPDLIHNSECHTGGNNVSLELTAVDVTQCQLKPHYYDYVYLDAFSPQVNPECWDQSALSSYFTALRNGGTLSTYSAKGSLRRNMLAVGFEVRKLPGPPGKREMVVAVRP